MAAFALLWLLSLLCGYAIVTAIWPHDRSWRALILRLALGVGPGVGIASGLYFLARAAGLDPATWVYLALLAMLTLALLILAAWRTGWQIGLERPGRLSGWSWLWLALLGFALILAVNVLLGKMLINPEGEWDAWAMWNLHARFLFQPGQVWQGMFDPALEALTHPDYPLLTPAMIALSWRALGRISTLAPIVTALIFTLATAGLLFTALNYQRKFTAACLAAIVALLSGSLLYVGSLLYADMPLTYMVLGAVACLYLSLKEGQRAWLVLSGMYCGLAAWTKNEGWSLMLAVLLSLLLALWLQRRSASQRGDSPAPTVARDILRPLGLFLLGGLPWLLVTFFYKQAFTPPNDLFAYRSLGAMLGSMMQLGRWSDILGRMLGQLSQYDGRILFILALVSLVVGLVKGPRLPSGAGWLVLGLVLLQYIAIYSLTPHDLDWHLDTALSRLVTHLYPAALFLVFTRLDLGEG